MKHEETTTTVSTSTQTWHLGEDDIIAAIELYVNRDKKLDQKLINVNLDSSLGGVVSAEVTYTVSKTI